MLRLFLATHRIRRTTHRIGKITSSCAILFGLSVLSLAQASVYCPGGSCGGINAGVNFAAGNIPGVTTNTPANTIGNIISVAVSYVNILAVAVIIIAGFYLILGLGNENSKETAKKIILYTAIGIVIISLANTIVSFFMGISSGTTINLTGIIQGFLNIFTSYVGILAVAVIIIAGFYLILGLGDESSKETARKIVLYTAIGIILILLANVIVSFFQNLPTGTDSGGAYGAIRTMLFFIISFAGLLAVAAIIIAGIMLLVSFGDETRKDTAKKIIIYAVAGLLVIGLSSVIVGFVDSLI